MLLRKVQGAAEQLGQVRAMARVLRAEVTAGSGVEAAMETGVGVGEPLAEQETRVGQVFGAPALRDRVAQDLALGEGCPVDRTLVGLEVPAVLAKLPEFPEQLSVQDQEELAGAESGTVLAQAAAHGGDRAKAGRAKTKSMESSAP